MNRNGNKIDLKELFLTKNYTLEDVLKIALFNSLKNKLKNSNLNSNDINKKEDIGMDDDDLFCP